MTTQLEELEIIKNYLGVSSLIVIIIFGILVFSFIYIDFKQTDIETKQRIMEAEQRNTELELYFNKKRKQINYGRPRIRI